jgi:hypothetical protein
MNANSPEELEIMTRIGHVWADAIGENFARPHYPYVDRSEAYTPPASPPQVAEPALLEHVEKIFLPK